MTQVVLGAVDILDGSLDGASSFLDSNRVRKGDDVEVVVDPQVTQDHIRGLFSLWDTDEVKEMDQGWRSCSRLKGYVYTRY